MCLVACALCLTPYALFPYALCPVHMAYHLCQMPFALCPVPCGFCSIIKLNIWINEFLVMWETISKGITLSLVACVLFPMPYIHWA